MNLDEMRARHVIFTTSRGTPCGCATPHCAECGKDWPCDAARLLALLTPEWLAAALHAQCEADVRRLSLYGVSSTVHGPDAHLRDAAALLAELSKTTAETIEEGRG